MLTASAKLAERVSIIRPPQTQRHVQMNLLKSIIGSLQRQVQHLQNQVDELNKDERDDDPTDTVDQQIPPQ